MPDPIVLTVVLLSVAGVVVAGIWVYRWARTSAEEVYSHFRCPGCKRRIRYKKKQVGNRGQCSNCGKALIFPPIADGVD